MGDEEKSGRGKEGAMVEVGARRSGGQSSWTRLPLGTSGHLKHCTPTVTTFIVHTSARHGYDLALILALGCRPCLGWVGR